MEKNQFCLCSYKFLICVISVIDSDATSQTTVDDIAAALAATNLNSSEESTKRLDGPNDYYKDEVDQKSM